MNAGRGVGARGALLALFALACGCQEPTQTGVALTIAAGDAIDEVTLQQIAQIVLIVTGDETETVPYVFGRRAFVDRTETVAYRPRPTTTQLSIAVAVRDATGGLVCLANGGGATISPGTMTPLDLLLRMPVVKALSIAPPTASIDVMATQAFVATATLEDDSTRDATSEATWASSDVAVATAGASGRATSLQPGTASISATFGAATAKAALTVGQVAVVSLTITPQSPTLPVNGVQQLMALGTSADGASHDVTAQVTWASSQMAVARVSATGLATALSVGATGIHASLGAISATTQLTVTGATLTALHVTPVAPTTPAGVKVQLTATGVYSDGTMKDVTNQAIWVSAATSVATVSNASAGKPGGLTTPIAVGTAAISATMAGITAATVLTVTTAKLLSISITPANRSLPLGTTQQLAATGTYSDGSTRPITSLVTWASSAPTVATVSSAGVAAALALGTTQITATLDMVTGTTGLSGIAPVVVSITVAPSAPTIAVGTTQQLTASGTYSDGSTRDVTTLVVWASTFATLATVSNVAPNNGLATAVAVGKTTISATLGGIAGTTLLTIQ